MDCRDDRSVPWANILPGPDELLDQEDARFGTDCHVHVLVRANGRAPLREGLDELRRGADEEVLGELGLALGSLVQFTHTPPRYRRQDMGTWHYYKKSYVKRNCGVDEPLFVFGTGKGTQVRIPAVIRSGLPATIVLLDVVYKTATKDKRYWRQLGSMMKALRR